VNQCLTPKAANLVAGAHDLGRLAQTVGAELVALKIDDITDLTFEELQAFADHIYRARYSLKKCRETNLNLKPMTHEPTSDR
jgi:hypothetical protein